jgi:hypothetical protein
MAKTFIPSAVDTAGVLHKYLTRWQPKLEAGLTTEQVTCLTTLITALAGFLACVTKPPISP